MRRTWFAGAHFPVMLALLCTSSSPAQISQGSLFGTVRDSTGGVIPAVMLTLMDVNTGQMRTTATDSMGQYSVLQLPAGTYSLTAQVQGFQTIRVTQIPLAVGQNARYDLTMQVGGTTGQSVTVTGEAPLVETTEATLSSEVTNKQLVDLPLNGRSFTDLVQLSPGSGWATSVTPFPGIFGGKGTRITVNGSGINGNLWYVDGTLINDNYNRTPGSMAGVMLGVDAVEEFKTYLSTNTAELPGMGGVIDIVTKSGTNDIHGDAFFFFRDKILNARDFFDPATPPPFVRKQYGGTLGGPIVKDKLFYFGSFEQFRQTSSVNQTYLVPDYLSQQGLVPNGSGGRTPITVAPVIRQQVLPMWGSLLPTASTPASAEDGTTGYDFVQGVQLSPIVDSNYVGRLDYHPSSRDAIFTRFTFDEGHGDVYSSASYLPNFPEYQYSRGLYFTLGYTRVVSTNLVQRATFSYTAPILDSDSRPTGAIPPLSVPGRPSVYESIAISGGPTIGGNSIDPFINVNAIPQFRDELSYVRGGHTIKFGGSLERFAVYSLNGDFNSGSWTFPNLTNFLQGIPTRFSYQAQNSTTERDYHQATLGLYIADQWKLIPRLTLNYGLRYDVTSGPTDPKGRESFLPNPLNFPGPCNFSSTQPLGSPGVPFCPGTGPSNFVTGSYWPGGNYYRDFQPRLGLAWDLAGNGKTVVRAGAGIYTQQILEDFYVTDTYTVPFTVTGVIGAPTTAPMTSSCFPTPITTNDMPVAGCPAPNLNGSSRLVVGSIKDPTTYRYNLTIQRQIGAANSFSVSYVGSQGRHIPRAGANLNVPYPIGTSLGQPVYPGFTSSAELNSAACVKAGGCVVAPNVIVDDSSKNCWAVGNNCLANPNFGSLSLKSLDGISNYNSLQLEFDRRGKNFNLQTSYVWSKCIDTGNDLYNEAAEGGVTPYWQNIALDRDRCAFDQRHRVAGNFTYQLPGPSRGAMGRILGGWEYTNNLTISSGPPFSVPSAAPVSSYPYQLSPGGPVYAPTNFPSLYASTPLIVPGVQLIQPGNVTHYFNPAAIAEPAPGYLNTARWLGSGPGLVAWNASLIKNTTLTEKTVLQFRAECFNLPNHTNLAFPTGSPFSFTLNPATGVQVLTVNGNAGRITTTVTPGVSGRQIQLGMKLIF
ncbi:MAG: carboxypeptidase regulatory-like domain-containing protein [Acidobacteriia bacterium]|nr:carboxypeptidase regulatory-like domain-containing protein [Terriglobia bacterium]